MRRMLIAGNWKMYGSGARARSLAAALVQGLAKAAPPASDALICPPYVYLESLAGILHGSGLALGAQDVCDLGPEGAYTGEVSAAMLADCGCRYVIVGHSERRSLCSESDAQVARKFVTAQSAGLIPILCVGEQLAERERGATEAVVLRQLGAVLDAAGYRAFAQSVVAYEPVWAIGSGRTATPEQAQAVHAFIRARVARDDVKIAAGLRVIYGGSVKAANARGLFRQADIDGALVGGASLDAQEFLAICRAADEGPTS
ncbi:MAG: triose-phosphate isomerase [Gammaproteobacteria bacterium]